MQYVPLETVIRNAKAVRCDDDDYPVLSITKSDGIVLQSDKFKKRIASADTEQYKVVRRGQLVQGIHIDEANFGIQNIVDAGIVSPAYKIWDVDSSLIIPKYLEIVLRSPRSICYYSSKFNGSIKRRERLSDKDFLAMEIPCPSFEEQQHAIELLDKTSDVIRNRQQELQKLDELIKAQFVEMFVGKGHPLISIDDLSLGQGEYGAQSASTKYDPSRPRYVRITDINDDGTLNDDVVASVNNEDDEEYKLSYGDFLFARMGATVGKTYAYKDGNQIFAGYLIRYKLDLSKIVPEYLFAYTRLDKYWNWVKLNQSGAAQPGINAKKYGSLQIPVASLSEQRVFQDFVSQVDKSKAVIQKALNEVQLLFDSLMQQYFG